LSDVDIGYNRSYWKRLQKARKLRRKKQAKKVKITKVERNVLDKYFRIAKELIEEARDKYKILFLKTGLEAYKLKEEVFDEVLEKLGEVRKYEEIS
jgi:DNA polymerase III delta prime subunit